MLNIPSLCANIHLCTVASSLELALKAMSIVESRERLSFKRVSLELPLSKHTESGTRWTPLSSTSHLASVISYTYTYKALLSSCAILSIIIWAGTYMNRKSWSYCKNTEIIAIAIVKFKFLREQTWTKRNLGKRLQLQKANKSFHPMQLRLYTIISNESVRAKFHTLMFAYRW